MSANVILALPVVIPLIASALCALLWRLPDTQRTLSVVASFAHLGASFLLMATVLSDGVIASRFGNWPAPFAITFVADLFGAAMIVITGILSVAVVVYGLAETKPSHERAGFHSLYQGLIFGVSGAFLTADIFNLYVWFEVMLISSFGLLVLGGTREQLDAGVKYVCLNLISTTLFLIGIGLLYGISGTLNMGDLALVIPEVENRGLVMAIAVLFLLAFGMKAAVFPLFYWLPASYHTAPAPVAAIFAGLLTKVGVYAIIRVFTLIFPASDGMLGPMIGTIAAFTMITGVLGAAFHYDIRRILSFHIVSQIGYMLIGLAVWTPLAIAGSILYVIHHIVVKANLFLVAGVINRLGGSFHLTQVGGLWRTAPWLAVLFAIPALSLAGLPPLSGFWSKLVVIQSSLEAEHWVLAGVAAAVGILTLFSMVKIWNEAFWKTDPRGEPEGPRPAAGVPVVVWAPIVGLCAVTMTIGLWTEPFADVSIRAAAEMLQPTDYIAAVTGLDVSVVTAALAGGAR